MKTTCLINNYASYVAEAIDSALCQTQPFNEINQNNTKVQIGIATKDRWDDLKVTLEKIRDFGWGEMGIVIFDDHSAVLCPYDVSEICPGATLTRFDQSTGYIVRRNQIAEQMTAKYYLSLDDDSFPFAGSLDAAVEYADSLPNSFCLGFPIWLPRVNAVFEESLQAKPFQTRAFIGCAHLLNRQRFLEIGGYQAELIHQTEESEVSARALQRGWTNHHFSGLQIAHMATNVGRSYDKIEYFSARNTLLWNDWYVPASKKSVKQLRAIVLRFFRFVRDVINGGKRGGVAGLKGCGAGLRDIPRYAAWRKPLTPEQYRIWLSLPPS